MKIAIIGGGMAGVTMALALSHLNNGKLTIDLVEAVTPDSYAQHPGFDARVIAVAHGTCRTLNRINIWPTLYSCATAITTIEVSDRGHIGKVHINASEYQLPALGYVLELQKIGNKLFSLLRKAPGVILHCPTALQHIQRLNAYNIITLTNGQKIRANLIVAADGYYSSLASQCGISWQYLDYQQIAIISNISTGLHHEGNAFERFTKHGSIALLPLSGGRSSLVWCLPTERQSEIINLNDEQFCQAIQEVFGWRLGKITSASKRYFYKIKLCIAERHIAHRLALIGNAAQTLHPIAGQGFNIGQRDVMTLAEILTQAAAQGEDIGDYPVLARYQRRRNTDQASVVGITDWLIHIFSNCHWPLVVGRNFGLLAMAHIPSLRNLLVRKMISSQVE